MPSQTIIHVINSLGVGGAEVLLVNTIRLLPEYNHVLVTLGPEAELLADIEPQLEAFYCLNALAVSAWPKGIFKLRGIIRKHQPLLVHAHLQVAGIISKLGCPRRVPLFYSIHSPYSIDAFKANRFALPLEKLTARNIHHLIGVSKLALDDYKKFVTHSGSGDVVHNMVGPEFFKAAAPVQYPCGEPLRCVSVGNLKEQKNYYYTLRAFTQLKELPITLDIYGGGVEEKELKAFVESEGLTHVRFMGRTQHIANILPQYHCYIISSVSEGFGIAPLEAMAVGLPVFASDLPVFHEVAGDTIQYFNLNQLTSLAELLQAAQKGSLPLNDLASVGKLQARKIAHPDTYIRSLKAVYEKYIS